MSATDDVLFGAGALLLGLSSAWFYLSARPPRRGRARRRGGYMDLSSRASTSASPLTERVLRTSTGCKPDGKPLAGTDGRALRAALSSSGARGFSIAGTESRRGGPTTAADRFFAIPEGIEVESVQWFYGPRLGDAA